MPTHPHHQTSRCKVAALLILTLLLGGCTLYSNNTFEPYSGPNEVTGQGGSMRTVNGIDIWDTGSPPRRFRILGYIFQHNVDNASDAMSVIANLDTENEVIKQAKKAGGDAIILEVQNSKNLGYTGNVDYYGNYSATSTTMTNSRIAVIKYLP
jgi:hypothetical protein